MVYINEKKIIQSKSQPPQQAQCHLASSGSPKALSRLEQHCTLALQRTREIYARKPETQTIQTLAAHEGHAAAHPKDILLLHWRVPQVQPGPPQSNLVPNERSLTTSASSNGTS